MGDGCWVLGGGYLKLETETAGFIWAQKKKDDMNHSRRPPENFNGCWC